MTALYYRFKTGLIYDLEYDTPAPNRNWQDLKYGPRISDNLLLDLYESVMGHEGLKPLETTIGLVRHHEDI